MLSYKTLSIFFAAFSVGVGPLALAQDDNDFPTHDFKNLSLTNQPKILINNRVLTKVNGKPISVIDLAKRLDLIFHREYSHLEDSVQARYQFYMYHWRSILNDLIDSELIIADADEKKIPVSDGDIRQELEQTFGPNVVETIDHLGLSFDEAWKLIKTEVIVRRMTMYMITSKAAAAVNPGEIRHAYERHISQTGIKEEWAYRLITVRHSSPEKGAETAQFVRQLLDKEPQLKIEDLPQLVEKYKEMGEVDAAAAIQVSESFRRGNEAIAGAHKEVLQNLVKGTFSNPIAQLSRADGITVHRIFFLEDHLLQNPPTFTEFQKNINQVLFQDAMGKEQTQYLTKLRQHFGIDQSYVQQMIPEDFQPFSLN